MKVTSRDGGANTYFMRARARVCVWCACVGGCWVWGVSWVVTLGVQNLTHQDHTNGVKTGSFCQRTLTVSRPLRPL